MRAAQARDQYKNSLTLVGKLSGNQWLSAAALSVVGIATESAQDLDFIGSPLGLTTEGSNGYKPSAERAGCQLSIRVSVVTILYQVSVRHAMYEQVLIVLCVVRVTVYVCVKEGLSTAVRT